MSLAGPGSNSCLLRHALQVSSSVTDLKACILDIFLLIADFRANLRLAQLLYFFKSAVKEKAGFADELTKFHSHVRDGTTESYQGPLTDTIFHGYEKLFESHELDLDSLAAMGASLGGTASSAGRAAAASDGGTGGFVHSVLLDLLFYEDDRLFAKALAVLDRNFGQRLKLLEAVKSVTLLPSPRLSIFGNVSKLRTDLGYLHFLLVSSDVRFWGGGGVLRKRSTLPTSAVQSSALSSIVLLTSDTEYGVRRCGP